MEELGFSNKKLQGWTYDQNDLIIPTFSFVEAAYANDEVAWALGTASCLVCWGLR